MRIDLERLRKTLGSFAWTGLVTRITMSENDYNAIMKVIPKDKHGNARMFGVSVFKSALCEDGKPLEWWQEDGKWYYRVMGTNDKHGPFASRFPPKVLGFPRER